MTKFAPHKALKLIAEGKLTFDERVVLHRVESHLLFQKSLSLPRSLALSKWQVIEKAWGTYLSDRAICFLSLRTIDFYQKLIFVFLRTGPPRYRKTCRDRLRVGWLNGFSFLWEGYHERRRCSRDTYPESYIAKYTIIRR